MSRNTLGALVYPMSNNFPCTHRTHELHSDTTCWELPLDQNLQMLVNNHIDKDKDPQEVVSPYCKS